MNAMPYTSHAPLIVKLTKRNILTKDPLDNQVLSYNIVIPQGREKLLRGKKFPTLCNQLYCSYVILLLSE